MQIKYLGHSSFFIKTKDPLYALTGRANMKKRALGFSDIKAITTKKKEKNVEKIFYSKSSQRESRSFTVATWASFPMTNSKMRLAKSTFSLYRLAVFIRLMLERQSSLSNRSSRQS